MSAIDLFNPSLWHRHNIYYTSIIYWENAYTEKFNVQFSTDGLTWHTVYTEDNWTGGK